MLSNKLSVGKLMVSPLTALEPIMLVSKLRDPVPSTCLCLQWQAKLTPSLQLESSLESHQRMVKDELKVAKLMNTHESS